jgi:hypothetical protein
MQRTRVLCLVAALLLPLRAAADSPLGMSYIESKDARVVYADPLAYIAPHALRTFSNSLAWQRKTFGWAPYDKTTILLKDLADTGGAIGLGLPRNTVWMEIEPLSRAFETFSASERTYMLMNHELVHLVQADMATEQDRRWRRFFHGKIAPQSDDPESLLYSYLTNPRFSAPRWYMEGGAVFFETWMGGGLGRAQGGYDEMVFRAMVRDDVPFYDPLSLVSRGVFVDFQVGANAYLYGTRFVTWLAYTYSPEKVVAWYTRDEGSARYYSDRFQQVFGLPLEQAWQKWVAFEHEFQRRNLADVRKYPITAYKQLVPHAVGSVSRTYYDEATGMLYGAFRSAGTIEYVGAIDTKHGTIHRLADIKRAMLYRVSSVAYDAASGTLFYTNDNVGNLSFRDLMAVDVHTGEQRVLLRDARIGEIVLNPVDRTLWGVQHNAGVATLVRIPYPYTEALRVYTFSWEAVPSDLDISPDGRLLSASMSELSGDQYLRVWELDKVLAGDIRPLSEFRFGTSVPESFTFSKDGRYLYGSSYYTGVSNIFRYEVATGKVDAVSNAEVGFFRPVPLADGRLLIQAYTSEGFVPATIEPPRPLEDVSAIKFLGAELADKYPIVKTWQVPSPATVDERKLVIDQGPWDPLHHLSLTDAYPVLRGYKDSVGIGYRLNIEDPLAFAKLAIVGSYTPSTGLPPEQRGHVDISGSYLNWRSAFAWNPTDFYDLFGPVKRSRKGYAAKLGYDWGLIYDEPRRLGVALDAAWYDQIDRLPNAQNVTTDFSRLLTLDVALRYTDLRRAQGAIDDEKGLAWSVTYQGNQVSSDHVPQVYGTLDYGIALPLQHSSIWLRGAAGGADGSQNMTVANFYFGSFGNNYVDDRPVKRYRDVESLPGFGIDEINALRFVKGLVEWDAPPAVFSDVGTPVLHLSSLQPSIFAAGLWTQAGSPLQHKDYASIGGQADFRFGFMHWYNLTLSVGYAVGYQGSQRAGDEWMVSLKIM